MEGGGCRQRAQRAGMTGAKCWRVYTVTVRASRKRMEAVA
jgi:hypothetical protein